MTAIKSEECISLTPTGRELRRTVREDGTETFAVQPPNDNYWVEAESISAVLAKAGWTRSIPYATAQAADESSDREDGLSIREFAAAHDLDESALSDAVMALWRGEKW